MTGWIILAIGVAVGCLIGWLLHSNRHLRRVVKSAEALNGAYAVRMKEAVARATTADQEVTDLEASLAWTEKELADARRALLVQVGKSEGLSLADMSETDKV